MYLIFILLSFLLVRPNVFSQTGNSSLPVISSSPTAFNLGKYGFQLCEIKNNEGSE